MGNPGHSQPELWCYRTLCEPVSFWTLRGDSGSKKLHGQVGERLYEEEGGMMGGYSGRLRCMTGVTSVAKGSVREER